MPRARKTARGSCRDGLARSLAAKVITPNPRKAKKVSATLATMSRNGGYSDVASSPGSRLASVTTASTVSEPSTTMTTTVWAWATALEPATLRSVIPATTSTANTFSHTALLSVNISLA